MLSMEGEEAQLLSLVFPVCYWRREWAAAVPFALPFLVASMRELEAEEHHWVERAVLPHERAQKATYLHPSNPVSLPRQI
jgi:hypothetical protein